MLLTSTAQTTFGMIITKTDSIVNTFTPVSVIINNLLIGKTVEHPFGEDYVIPEDIEFDFAVDLGSSYSGQTVKTSYGEVTADENGVITVSVKPGRSISIEGIEEGTVAKVTELLDAESGFTVKDGILTKEITVTAEGNAVLDFINVYRPSPVQPTNVTVRGSKTLEGRQWLESDSFTFLLQQDKGDEGLVDIGTKTVTYDQNDPEFNRFDFSDVFASLSFDSVGTYNFRLTEVVGGLSDIDYDESVNTFAIVVTDVDMDGKLEINRVLGAQNAKVSESDQGFDVNVSFNNTYIPPDVPKPGEIAVDITVNKTVKNTGSSKIDPEGFRFVLENTTTGETKALRTDKNGNAKFSLIYGAADIGMTYEFKLSETDEGKQGITYDKRVYNLSVTIVSDDDNKPKALVTVNGTPTDNCVAEFENVYSSSTPSTPSTPSAPNQGGAPQTGDDSHILFWVIMMLVSASMFIILLNIDRRYSKHRA